MITVIATIDNEAERYNMKQRCAFLDYVTTCVNCGTVMRFGESDIDRHKLLPHLQCVNCSHEIQLHAKYKKRAI